MNVQEYLSCRRIWFEVINHERSFDAQHLARAAHIPGKEVAKAVLLRVNGGYKYFAAILPATHVIDFKKLSRAFGGAEVHLATQSDLVTHCHDCEAGMMSPFGSRYGLETVVDPSVVANEFIVIEGSCREEAIRMRYRDFYALEHPTTVEFARPASGRRETNLNSTMPMP